jgi:hypothetical protein
MIYGDLLVEMKKVKEKMERKLMKEQKQKKKP